MVFKKKQQAQTAYENKSILNDTTPFNIKEAYKVARTNIMFSLPGEGCKRIVISSSYPGEGKTTTTINLAITFAQTGARVLVIDCDMRKPRISGVMDLGMSLGLSNVLGGFNPLEEVLVSAAYENLDVIGAGQIPPNPAELLASRTMQELLDYLSGQYDYIFLDTPPINMVTDTTVLTACTDGVVMVTRQNYTHHKDIQDALGKLELAGAKVLGSMLSGVKQPKGLGYKKYGKYGKYNNYDYTYGYGESV
ncbi:MAG: CpsD/CapB family tyrosine-protein kinase [Cellulosilyticaceae bacterium]